MKGSQGYIDFYFLQFSIGREQKTYFFKFNIYFITFNY